MSVVLKTPNTDLLVQGKPITYLTAEQASGTATLTVESIFGFAVSDQIALGQIGEEKSEIIQVHTVTTPTGTTITLASNLIHSHEEGTPVYVVGFDEIEFSRATTEVGAKSVLATVSISADNIHTIYDDTVNSAGFGFWRFKESVGSTFSDYSDAIPYAGYDLDAASEIFDRALSAASENLSPRLRYEDLYNFLNDFVGLANSENTRWSEAKVLNYELATVATGYFEYTIPDDIARESEPGAVIALRIRDYPSLQYVPQRDWNKVIYSMSQTTVDTVIADVDTSIVLTNSSDFFDDGSVTINGDVISYTANDRSTNTLSGVTGIATGGHAAGSLVFQSHTTGVPRLYTFSARKKLRVWPIADSTVNNRTMYLDYFQKIPRVNSIGDKILIKNTASAIEYVAYRIKKHVAGGKLSVSDEDYQMFLEAFRTTIERDRPGEPLRVSVR